MSDKHDVSTHRVINWLIYLKIPYYRINDTSSVCVDYLATKNGKFDFKLSVASPYSATPFLIFADDVKAYWYRRGSFELEKIRIQELKSKNMSIVKEKFNKYLDDENKKIVDFFHNYLTTIPHLGCFLDNFTINKLFILCLAQKEKILIPEYIVTSKKSDIEFFVKQHNSCITKGIDRNSLNISKGIGLGNSTVVITESKLSQLLQNFNYSFIQQYIEKRVDIRVFYLDGKIYSTAIFSQNDEKTRIDFRNYNEEKPNRIQPFKMPINEEKKLKKLMKKLNYKTGSIDYVLDKNNNLFFLEINPIGQYDFISYKCNLFLDKIICNYFKSRTR
jgi:ATP-GRASP peptide maturase of grasp-with-spasm system